MVAKNLFGNRQTNDTATVASPITTNPDTSVLITPANPNRIFFEANIKNLNQNVFIKLQATSVDDEKKGIFVTKSKPYTMTAIYTGEICAIADIDNPEVNYTEY